MKKDICSGSSSIVYIENKSIHEAYKQSCAESTFYQLIRGTEITVDCMFDTEGRMIGYNQRKRLKTIGGAVSITQNTQVFDILPFLKRIAEHWKFYGCVNFQYILKNNTPYFIDINLRYPSGGLPLTVESGLDIPDLTIKLLTGQNVSPYVPVSGYENMIMYRYFEELFEK